MKVAISGASGLIGKALVAALKQRGDQVVRLVRRRSERPDEVRWDPDHAELDPTRLEGIDAFVHLAGENLAAGRWTASRKQRIVTSRVEGTRMVARTLAELQRRPRVFISASAIGYYGHIDAGEFDEQAIAGAGFLAELCEKWEAATQPAVDVGIRVVHARFGIVLAKEGGALAKMIGPFALGLGGRMGSGEQPMSWVSLEDAVAALIHALNEDELRGPVNIVAPSVVSNAEFTQSLAKALHRPALIPIPKFALRAGMGSEMAEEMLLGGARVVPKVLQTAGFEWKHSTLEEALAAVL